MFYGWSVFSYTKKIIKETDKVSFCNADIKIFSQPLFQDDPADKIFIYSSACKSLELILNKETIQIRLFLWEESKTSSFIIESNALSSIFVEFTSKKVLFNKTEVTFYNLADLESFRIIFESFITEKLLETKKNNDTAKVNKEKHVMKFIEEFKRLSGNCKLNAFKIEINSCSEFIQSMRMQSQQCARI